MNSMISVASPLQPQVKLTKFQKAFVALGVIMIVALALAMFPLAGGTDTGNAIQSGIKNGTHQLWNIMTAIVLPIGAVAFAWNAFKMLFGGQKGMEEAKRNMLIIVVVVALVWLAPIVIEQVNGWFKGTDTGDVFS